MTSDSQFNAIRPYIGEEIPAAVERLSQAEEFLTLFSQMTRVDKSKIQEQLKGITSREQFQSQFFGPTIQRLIAGTTQGVTATGLEYIEKDKSYHHPRLCHPQRAIVRARLPLLRGCHRE